MGGKREEVEMGGGEVVGGSRDRGGLGGIS